MSNKPIWFTGLIVVIVGVIWWGLTLQEREKSRKSMDALEEKIKIERVFIVEQDQQIKSMAEKLKTMDEKALADQFTRLQNELKEFTLKTPNDKLGREQLMNEMIKVQMKLNGAREQREALKARIESFKASVSSSKATLAENEKKLKELRGGK